jgi:hypothetical protein
MADRVSSPYLKNPQRLSEVIAAIQVLGTYKYYKRNFVDWAKAISGDKEKGEFWKNIFLDHPEFSGSIVAKKLYPLCGGELTRKGITWISKKRSQMKNATASKLKGKGIEFPERL